MSSPNVNPMGLVQFGAFTVETAQLIQHYIDAPADALIQVAASDQAITIPEGTVLITKPVTAAHLTLATPTAGARSQGGEDGNMLRLVPIVQNAHVITTSTNGFNGNHSILTLVPPSSGLLFAYNGIWYLVTNNAGTLSG